MDGFATKLKFGNDDNYKNLVTMTIIKIW